MSVTETVLKSKEQLDQLLKSKYVEDSLLLGSISFTQSKIDKFIWQDLLKALDHQVSSIELLDTLWLDFHYPVIKHFQSHFNAYKRIQNGAKLSKPVEIRKLFDIFHKFIKTFHDFYFKLVQKLLSSFDLSEYIPTSLMLKKFDLGSVNDLTKLDDGSNLISNVVYLIHKSILSIADLSRYRSMVARSFVPAKSRSRSDSEFSVAIDWYNLCITILPSFGDPYHHIAIIDNVENDKFNVVYNFLRSSMTRIPSELGFHNLIKLLAITDVNNSILNEYKRISTITDPEKINTLNLIKIQFLCLFNYNFMPKFWQKLEGTLVNGVPVKDLENAFFENLISCDYIGKNKRKNGEMLTKQFIVLVSGLHILSDKKQKFENENLDKNSKIIGSYLRFFFKFLKNVLTIIQDTWDLAKDSKYFDFPLLDLYRIILAWLKECKLGFQYLSYHSSVLSSLLLLSNFEAKYISQRLEEFIPLLALPQVTSDELKSTIILKKFERLRFFKEDLMLKEFTPIGGFFKDFNDSHFFVKSETNCLRLVGILPENDKETRHDENLLRVLSTFRLGQGLISTSLRSLDVAFTLDSKTLTFTFDAKPKKKSEKAGEKDVHKKDKNNSQNNSKDKNTKKQDRTDSTKPQDNKKSKGKKTSKLTPVENKDPLLQIQETIRHYQQMHADQNGLLSVVKKPEVAKPDSSRQEQKPVKPELKKPENITPQMSNSQTSFQAIDNSAPVSRPNEKLDQEMSPASTLPYQPAPSETLQWLNQQQTLSNGTFQPYPNQTPYYPPYNSFVPGQFAGNFPQYFMPPPSSPSSYTMSPIPNRATPLDEKEKNPKPNPYFQYGNK